MPGQREFRGPLPEKHVGRRRSFDAGLGTRWPYLGIHVILHVMTKATAVRESVQRYRQRMQRAGFRLIQLWVPDTRAEGFAEECRRQSRAAARNKRAEDEVTTWIEANETPEGWTR